MNSSVLDVIDLMVKHNISGVPIVNSSNRVLNVFEAVDVIPCIKDGTYDELGATVGDALTPPRRGLPPASTPAPRTTRLDSIFETVRKSRVHRLIVVDDEMRLKGVISLSDILKYVLLHGEEEDRVPDS